MQPHVQCSFRKNRIDSCKALSEGVLIKAGRGLQRSGIVQVRLEGSQGQV